MQKELVSLSPVRIEAGRVELGKNRAANRVLVSVALALAIGGASAALASNATWAIGLLVTASLLEANRRWANRCHLLVQADGRVSYAPLRGSAVVEYREPELGVDVYSYAPSEGAGLHHSARLRFSHAAMPDILVQDALRWRSNERGEREGAEKFVAAIRCALQMPAPARAIA